MHIFCKKKQHALASEALEEYHLIVTSISTSVSLNPIKRYNCTYVFLSHFLKYKKSNMLIFATSVEL